MTHIQLIFVENMGLLSPGFCDRAQKQCRPPPAISEKGEKRSAVLCQVTGVHLMCEIFMNDLLTEQGQQRSRVIRLIIDAAQRSLANRNHIQITIRSQ